MLVVAWPFHGSNYSVTREAVAKMETMDARDKYANIPGHIDCTKLGINSLNHPFIHSFTLYRILASHYAQISFWNQTISTLLLTNSLLIPHYPALQVLLFQFLFLVILVWVRGPLPGSPRILQRRRRRQHSPFLRHSGVIVSVRRRHLVGIP